MRLHRYGILALDQVGTKKKEKVTLDGMADAWRD